MCIPLLPLPESIRVLQKTILMRSLKVPSHFFIFFYSFLLPTLSRCVVTAHKLMKTGLFEIISETVMLKIAPILEKGEAIFLLQKFGRRVGVFSHFLSLRCEVKCNKSNSGFDVPKKCILL